jgi:biotin carboxylase
MPVVGTPVTPIIVSVDQVRMFLRDFANKNILLDNVQFTQDEVNLAVEMATSAFNAVTPQTSLVPASWPQHLQYVLLLGTARFLMMSESFLQIRNQATYQDGEIAPIGIDDKQAAYSQLAQLLKAEWDELVRGIKTQNNMESAYNDLGSGYRNVARFNHS